MSALDMSARYTVKHWPGVAVSLLGWEQRWEPLMYYTEDADGEELLVPDPDGEGEWVDDPDGERVRAVMVGDDQVHMVSVGDLTPLDELDYCAECGQVGCAHDGRERGEA